MESTMCFHIIAHVVFGLCLGYVVATFSESFFHHHVGHARSRLLQFWARYPIIGKPFLDAYYEHHIIHHARTFRKDFVTQFRSPEEEAKLYEKMPPTRRDMIKDEEYGVTLKGFGVLMFVLPVTPAVPILYLLFGFWVTLGAMFPMFIVYPLMSKWIHRMIHMRDDDVLHKCSKLEIWIMNTRYIRRVIQGHFLHHEYVLCNFNLLLGGDYLRHYHREPSEKDLAKMRSVGLEPVKRKTLSPQDTGPVID
jgi:hypothetical protein